MASAIKNLPDAELSFYNKGIDFFDLALMRDKALAGDILLKRTPATLGSSAAAVNAAIGGVGAKFSRTIVVSVVDSDGNVHAWFNGTIAIAEAEVTNGDGTASIRGGGSTVVIVAGVGSVILDYIGTWAEGDTETLTFGNSTQIIYTLANKTSVDTLIA